MTDSANPNNPPAAPVLRPGEHAIPGEPVCALLALCVECGRGLELPLPLDQRVLSFVLAQHGWFISVMSPPNQAETPMLIGPLCTACAQQVYSPEVFAAAEQRRQQLLQATEQAAQAYAAQMAEEPR